MINYFPLLHAAQTAIEAGMPVHGWPLIFGAGVAFGAAAAGVPRLLRRARTRRRIVSTAAALLTLLAVLPSVLPYDHMLQSPAQAAEHSAVHAAHCHENTAECADAPVTSGPGQLIDAAPLVVAPLMLSILVLINLPALTSLTRRTILRPPMLAATASI